MGSSKISKKLLFPIYSMAGIFILFMLIQLLIIYKNLGAIREMDEKYFTTVTKSDDLKLHVVQVQQWLTDISATRAAKGFDDGFDEAAQHAEQVKTLIAELKELDPDYVKDLDAIQSSFDPYYETGKLMAQAYIDQGPQGGNEMMGEFDSVAESINSNVDSFMKTSKENIGSAIQKIEGTIFMSIFLCIVSFLASILTSLISRKNISNCIVHPILDITEAARHLAKGELNTKLTLQSSDEIGDLGKSIQQTISTLHGYITDISNQMRAMEQGNLVSSLHNSFQGDFIKLHDSIETFNSTIRDAFTEINRSSGQVASSSDQVASGAQELAQGANEQMNSIQELSEAVNTITNNIDENVQLAASANDLAATVGNEANKSTRQMDHMVLAMDEIAESSHAIENIIHTIDDIANQTNLLSLNASIEAARAGEAGKGFAVVADQVRVLATQSAEAVQNTSALIERSAAAVMNGSQIADETAKSLSSVIDGINRIAEHIQNISSAFEEEAHAIHAIHTGTTQIADVIQAISSTSEESAAASEELTSQAQLLKGLIGKFRLS